MTFLRDLGEFSDDSFNGLLDAALKAGRIRAGGDVLQAFAIDRFGEDGGGRGAVTGDVAGLAGDFANELSAHIFIGILELDLFRDGHTVLGDRGAAEFLVEDDVATGRPESGLHGFREFLDTAKQGVPRGFVELELFSCHSR